MLRSGKVKADAALPSGAPVPQRTGDKRRRGGDSRGAKGTTGAIRGLGGYLPLLAVMAIATVIIAVFGALTTMADEPDLPAWQAWTASTTSGLTAFMLMGIPWLAVRRAPPTGTPWGRLLVIHGAAALTFSVLHVAGFVLLRQLVYRLMGQSYGFAPLLEEFPYELRKDLLTYLAQAGLFWLVGQLKAGRSVRTAEAPLFDIRDGARIIRTSPSGIIAASSAGNYVEFWLADGRRPLMRATLAAIELELGRFGFVRTHRSWLINAGAVTGLKPDGSGDWTVELGGIEAPLSRRYPQALDRLKG